MEAAGGAVSKSEAETKAEGKKPAPVKIAEGVEPDRKAAREWLRSVKGRLIKTGETVTIAGHELDVIDVNCPIPPEAVRNQFRNMKLTRSSRRLLHRGMALHETRALRDARSSGAFWRTASSSWGLWRSMVPSMPLPRAGL